MGETFVVFLGAAFAAGLGFLSARWQKPKITAESESLAVSSMRESLLTVREELAALKAHVDHLEGRVTELEGENHRLKAGNDILTGQVRELGGVPRWPKK